MAALSAFRRELDAYLDETLSVEGRREIFVGIARDKIGDFEDDWRAALSGDPDIQTFVDGAESRDFESVRIPGGTIAARVRPTGPIVDRALELFDLFTKTVTGEFKSKTVAFINDALTSVHSADARPGDQTFITNLSDFTWKGEVRGFTDKDSSGFSQGLMASIAKILKKEFSGGLVPIRFVGRSVLGRRLPGVLIG